MPHPSPRSGQPVHFENIFRILEVLLLTKKNSMTSLKPKSSQCLQALKKKKKPVYCYQIALWLLKKRGKGTHGMAILLRCPIRNNIWMKWL
jgi:hypothetical protein